MIKAEVVFNEDDSFIVNGLMINMIGGLDGDICISVNDNNFLSLFEAVKYCMESQDD